MTKMSEGLASYNSIAIEERWQTLWRERNIGAPTGNGDPYVICIPPPNVTGSLHMGHAFQSTLIDFLIRFHRKKGYRTCWQFGVDHAGIATQMVVERKLAARGELRKEIGREKFLQHVWEWKAESGGTIAHQLQRLGCSVNWEDERFTMDKNYSRAVEKVFCTLYEQGFIYRGKRLVNWDPKLQTAISDLEVINEEEEGKLYTVKYLFVEGEGSISIATTRPETILADGAIAIHPDDQRFTHLLGKRVWVPLTQRHIPIIADTYVDPSFGTGCVKITPAHDFNDYKVGLRHEMEVINLMHPDATMNENAPEKYRGMDRLIAREHIVKDLAEAGLLLNEQAHRLHRPRGDRTGEVIEPYMTDQWFVRASMLGADAMAVVKDKKIQFIPKQWENTYFHWMENLEDWCISRQLWWGHQIPAWYTEAGEFFVGIDEQTIRQQHAIPQDVVLTRDNDVLDTWFSSALWTFVTQGWPDDLQRLATNHPTSVLVTGFDIIFFWVARMVMMSRTVVGDIPFRTVYVHGLVRDGEGKKFSKSIGNVIDPLDLVYGIDLDTLIHKRTSNLMQPEKAERIKKRTQIEFPQGIASHGADALRFSFLAMASTGRDVRFDEKRIAGYGNLINKLWNAAKFVCMQLADYKGDFLFPLQMHAPINQWLSTHMAHLQETLDENVKGYRLDLYANTLYTFFWDQYCAWYLESMKKMPLPYQAESKKCLYTSFVHLLHLFHPLIPFVTEEIYQKIGSFGNEPEGLLSLAPFPDKVWQKYPDETEQVTLALRVIDGVRSYRASTKIAPKQEIELCFVTNSTPQFLFAFFAEHHDLLFMMAKVKNVRSIEGVLADASLVQIDTLQCYIPVFTGEISPQEKLRLEKEITQCRLQLERVCGQLANPNFLQKANREVIEVTKQKKIELENNLQELLNQQKN